MQRFTQHDKLLFTADHRSMAFSGLMLPDAIVAALESFDNGQLSMPLEFPEDWSASRLTQQTQATKPRQQSVRTSARKEEMRGDALRAGS